MKKFAAAARATTVTGLSKKLTRATFARTLQVTPCYPESNKSIHLH